MRRKSKRRRKKKKSIGAQHQNPASPFELYREKNYDEAARLLKEQLISKPTDDRKALLAECLYKLHEYREAINIIESIESCNSYLLDLAGVCCLRVEDYENAKNFLNQALQQNEHPHTYYLLAIAHEKDQKPYELDTATREIITGFLSTAVTLPECPLEAFLWLESLQRYEDPNIETRSGILEKAISLYPDSEEARVRLTGLYTYWLKQPRKALEVLQPLIDQSTSNPQVWMKAFYAARETGDYKAALQYLEQVKPSCESSRTSLAILKMLEVYKNSSLCEGIYYRGMAYQPT